MPRDKWPGTNRDTPGPERSRKRAYPVVGLQRAAGNRAVARAIAVQRQAAVAQREPAAETSAPFGASTALDRAKAIRVTATGRLAKVAAFNAKADTAMTAYRNMRTDFAQSWGAAWQLHSDKLATAREEAADQNEIQSLIVGTVAGVVVAAAAPVLFPTAASAAALSATWWAFNTGSAFADNVLGMEAGKLIERPAPPPPTSGKRDAEADAWRAIARAETSARQVAALAPKFGLELGNAEYSIAQVQAHIDGATTDMNWDQTLDMVSTLANWEKGLGPFDAHIDAKIEAMNVFSQVVADFQVPTVREMETHIWRAWMSKLNNESDEALDQGAIQDHLVRLGLLPDTWYLTDNDQHAAVAAAKDHIATMGPPRAP